MCIYICQQCIYIMYLCVIIYIYGNNIIYTIYITFVSYNSVHLINVLVILSQCHGPWQ